VSAGITPPFSLLPAHALDLNPLASFGPSKGSLVPRVFAGCYVPLLGVGRRVDRRNRTTSPPQNRT
jgi:hypothetical protein